MTLRIQIVILLTFALNIILLRKIQKREGLKLAKDTKIQSDSDSEDEAIKKKLENYLKNLEPTDYQVKPRSNLQTKNKFGEALEKAKKNDLDKYSQKYFESNLELPWTKYLQVEPRDQKDCDNCWAFAFTQAIETFVSTHLRQNITISTEKYFIQIMRKNPNEESNKEALLADTKEEYEKFL